MNLSNIIFTLDRYIPAVLSMTFTLILSKKIDVSVFGELSYYLAIVGVLSLFALGGLDQLLQREMVRNISHTNLLVNTFITIKLISLGIAYIVILFSLAFIPSTPPFYISILLLINVFNISESFRAVYVAQGAFNAQIFLTAPTSLISFILKLAILYFSHNPALVYVCLALDSMLLFLVLIRAYCRKYDFYLSLDGETIKLIWRDGKYLIISGAILMSNSYIDQLIVGISESMEVMANYSIALKFTSIFLLASTAFNLGYVTKLNSVSEDFLFICKKMLLFSSAAGVLFALLNALASPLVINHFFNNKYNESTNYIAWFSLTIFSYFMHSTTGRILVSVGKSRHVLIRNLWALILNLFLGIVLHAQYGVYGVIFATNISMFFSAVIYPLLANDIRPLVVKIITQSR